jgi:hypothetical protein
MWGSISNVIQIRIIQDNIPAGITSIIPSKKWMCSSIHLNRKRRIENCLWQRHSILCISYAK